MEQTKKKPREGVGERPQRFLMPTAEETACLADFFKMFSDPHRARILFAMREGELCVGELSILLDTTVSAVSHQLKLLRGVRLVRSRRVGKTVLYSLADSHVEEVLDQGLEHIKE